MQLRHHLGMIAIGAARYRVGTGEEGGGGGPEGGIGAVRPTAAEPGAAAGVGDAETSAGDAPGNGARDPGAGGAEAGDALPLAATERARMAARSSGGSIRYSSHLRLTSAFLSGVSCFNALYFSRAVRRSSGDNRDHAFIWSCSRCWRSALIAG